MLILRSVLFNIFFFVWNVFACIGLLWTLILPRRFIVWGVEVYEKGLDWGERVILNLDYEVRGRENLPSAPFILASKHQSAWETLKLALLVKDPGIVLKRELMLIPLWGWYAAKLGMIAVHRNKKGKTIPSLIAGAKKIAIQNRPIVIFPQGTRIAPGAKKPYKIGIALIYKELNLPLVPMALNSGVYWPRRSFIKKPGKVIVEFLPPIPPGLSLEEVQKKLQDVLETASNKLLAEAGRLQNQTLT